MTNVDENNKKQLWTVTIGGSDMDDAVSEFVRGSKKAVMKYLHSLVENDKIYNEENNIDSWDYGTENPEDVEDRGTSLYAYGCYYSSHIDYVARPFTNEIKELEEE